MVHMHSYSNINSNELQQFFVIQQPNYSGPCGEITCMSRDDAAHRTQQRSTPCPEKDYFAVTFTNIDEFS